VTTTFRIPTRGIACALGAFALALAAPFAWAQGAKNAVESVTFSAIQGGKVVVRVGMKEALAAPPQGGGNPAAVAIIAETNGVKPPM